MQVNELAFTQDGKLFLQATDSGVEVRPQNRSLDHVQIRNHNQKFKKSLDCLVSGGQKPLIPHA